MRGLFELRTAADMFEKLEAEYKALSAAPADSRAAYNFFVTAWHLLEWLYPDQARLKSVRDTQAILQVCEHLAVGAKHFRPTATRLRSVTETGRAHYWAAGYWHPRYWARGYWRDSLVVELDGAARDAFGPQMDVLPLAREAMKFWRSNTDLHPPTT